MIDFSDESDSVTVSPGLSCNKGRPISSSSSSSSSSL